MDDGNAESAQILSPNSDISQQLLTRYSKSSAAQHRHLCATAAATASIIKSSSLPLTPLSYFAATITSLSNFRSLDSTALAALTSFLSVVIPIVKRGEINPDKACEAVGVLSSLVEECGDNLGTSSVRAVVKCVGVLVAEFCDLDDWESVELGFDRLLKFSIDKRPKVRKCAKDCLLTVFKAFKSSSVIKKTSKLIYLSFKSHMPTALKITSPEIDESKKNSMPKPEHQEVFHLLNVMKHLITYFPIKINSQILSQLLEILNFRSSALTGHAFDIMLAMFENSGDKIVVPNAEEIFKSLVLYISMDQKNPVETAFVAANLAKIALSKVHDSDANAYFPLVTESLAGLLSLEPNIALQASNIFKELIENHINEEVVLTIKSQEQEDDSIHSTVVKAIKSTCTSLYNVLNTSSHLPNEHFLSVITTLFLKLDGASNIFMEAILLKLAGSIADTSVRSSEIKHLQDCIGSAITAMGPEKVLELLPISFNANDLSCSNSWLIPILKKNIFGSSLRFFMEHIVPLAETFEKASRKVKNSVIRQDMQAYAHGLWGSLPAFCRQPSDTYQSFGKLAKLLSPFLKKDSFMLENIAIGLQELVNQNKSALGSDRETRHFYSRKDANKNLKALALCSKELLQALLDVFFESPTETQQLLKGAISCLASICDSSVTKQMFIASLQKFQLLDDIGEHEKVENENNSSTDKEENGAISVGTDQQRCLILELASCFVDGSGEDLVNLLFCIIRRALQVADEVGKIEAYQTLSTILEKHSWFCSSQFDVIMDLLTGTKSSANLALMKERVACLSTLLIQAIKINIDEDNTKAFLILNEIILMLKDSNEEGRKVAYDAINGMSSKLRNSSDVTADGPYQKLIAMITGYLSGSSPHIKSGVVSALCVFIYNDPEICMKMPDMVPAVMELLHSKTIEVIKAVLGFVKVMVSCLNANDLSDHFLADIVDGILRWSSISRHHFREKVTVILEILMRKCGSPTVKALVPEKYKDFVQGVVTSRHGKTNSKKVGSAETKPEISDSSLRGNHKRKRDESSISTKEEDSARPWKKNSDKKLNFRSQSIKHQGGNRRDFKKNLSNGNNHKDVKIMKKIGGNSHRTDNASKFSKHKKSGEKGRKVSRSDQEK